MKTFIVKKRGTDVYSVTVRWKAFGGPQVEIPVYSVHGKNAKEDCRAYAKKMNRAHDAATGRLQRI